jgi:ABC-type polysaccharide/polyol phosphate transport system ATPase subunit
MTTFVKLKNASVSYPLFMSSAQRSVLAKTAKILSFGSVGSKQDGSQYVNAITNLTMSLSEGARVGLIGRNGSGKSTLLKLLAGVNQPTKGTREASGSVGTMLSTSAGLGGEKTGRQNIQLMGQVFGMSPGDIQEMILDVEDFTQLGQFFDLPVMSYSAGMQVRLAFALATSLPGDMLFIDEALGAGDGQFLARAAERLRLRVEKAKVLVIATHSVGDLERFCDLAVWLDRGRIVDAGDPLDIWSKYSQASEAPAPARNLNVVWPSQEGGLKPSWLEAGLAS